MRSAYCSFALVLSGLFHSCASFEEDSVEPGKVSRLYLMEEGKDAGLSGGAAAEYRFYYDFQDRVSRVSTEVKAVGPGSGMMDISGDYIYHYIDEDSLSVTRQVLQYGGGNGISENSLLEVRMDVSGRVASVEDSAGGLRMQYAYGEDSRLVSIDKVWLQDTAGQSTFHISVAWTEDGNIDALECGQHVYRFEYGDAPFRNNLNVDLACWLVEMEYLEEMPLWSIGLLGGRNRNLPSSVSAERGSERVRLIDFSYMTDGSEITSFSINRVSGGVATYGIDYE